MKRLTEEIIQFFQRQSCVVVSTVDKNGFPHSACKGIIKINKNGRIYLLDLYQGKTYVNLTYNPTISLTAVDDHTCVGYCLKGKAKIIPQKKLLLGAIKAWEARIASRLTQRLLKNIHEEKGSSRHPEALLPKPEYMILMEVKEIVDLTPSHLK